MLVSSSSRCLQSTLRRALHACRPCVAAVLAFVIAQTLKLFTYWYSERRWDFTRLIGSGGMPSSHTGCVSALLSYRVIAWILCVCSRSLEVDLKLTV